MHKEIFTQKQEKLLPLVAEFSTDFGLVGGTAIALHIGHRRSIDFDLFSNEKFGNQSLLNKISSFCKPNNLLVNRLGELTLIIDDVKLTFFHFPYKLDFKENFGYRIKVADLLTLAAMKAFALGQRAKWKDYIDLYFIIKNYFNIRQISEKCHEIFGTEYNEKLFRIQLSYFDGINYEEKVEYMPGFEISDETVKKELTEFSLS